MREIKSQMAVSWLEAVDANELPRTPQKKITRMYSKENEDSIDTLDMLVSPMHPC